MAMDKFRFPALPAPPPTYDAAFFRQFLRTIEIYCSQLDSQTPNSASLYRGIFGARNVTTAEKDDLQAMPGWVVFDTDLDKLCVYTSGGWETITST